MSSLTLKNTFLIIKKTDETSNRSWTNNKRENKSRTNVRLFCLLQDYNVVLSGHFGHDVIFNNVKELHKSILTLSPGLVILISELSTAAHRTLLDHSC